MFLTILLWSMLVIAFSVYFIVTYDFDYWKKRSVPHLKPRFFYGSYRDYLRLNKSYGEVAHEICMQLPDVPYIGVYYATKPALLVKDPDFIKIITTKEYNHFNSRELMNYTDREFVVRNMFFSHGARWAAARQLFTPLFTTAKLKNMFHLVQKCNRGLKRLLEEELHISEVVDVRSIMVRYTMDCIMSCTAGVETNTMDKTIKDNPFSAMGVMVFENSNKRAWKHISRTAWPTLFYGLGFQAFPVEIESFFFNLVTNVCKQRNYQPTSRNDFIDLLLNVKNNSSKGATEGTIELDDKTLSAQCVLLFSAGFETSATTLSFILFELAKNVQCQERAHKEIENYLLSHNGIVEFDCITQLPYLEACLLESMRLYPALGVITREVVKDYTLPTGLKLEKGLRIHLPVYHLHHNPDYFPNPEDYQPERFLPENKENIKPFTYMPFGEGPKTCIGLRMAKLMIISALVTILKKYRVELADEMPKSLTIDPRAFVALSKERILVKFMRR